MGGTVSQPGLLAVDERLQSRMQAGPGEQGSSACADSPTSSVCSTCSTWCGGAESTLIIFDWDDTLLCSSALDHSRWDMPELRQLERTVETILRTAMRLGETMIVTNGCGNWVQESSRAFLPGLVPTLESLAVLSARAMYEHAHPDDPASWKRRAFRRILKRKRADGYEGLNLVVLGDQSAEMQAVHSAAKVLRGPSLIKTVKFVEAPSVDQLLGQLRKVAQELGALICAEYSSSTGLAKRRLPEHQSHLEAWASGWTFSLGRDWAQLPSVLQPHAGDEEEEDLSLDLGPEKATPVCGIFGCNMAVLQQPLQEEIQTLSI